MKIFVALASVTIVAAAQPAAAVTPAQGARVLYSFAAADGRSAEILTDGFLSNSLAVVTGPSVIGCSTPTTVCANVLYDNEASGLTILPEARSGSAYVSIGRAYTFDPSAASTFGNFYATTNSGSIVARLTVSTLPDSDYIYALFSDHGPSATFITTAVIGTDQPVPTLTNPRFLSCNVGRYLLGCGINDGRNGPAGTRGANDFLFQLSGETADPRDTFIFPASAVASQGKHMTMTATGDIVANGLDVVGPLRSAADWPLNLVDNPTLLMSVPEPASWAMLVAGFGLVGAAVRRRGLAAA